MNTTSLSLLEGAALGGSSSSWDRFVNVYMPLLRSWLKRFHVQPADADDLVQEVFAVVARELPDFQHNQRKGAFRKWLRSVLTYRLREFWRNAKYRPGTCVTSVQRQLDELADDESQLSQLWEKEHDEFVMNRLMEQVRPRFDSQSWQAFRLQTISRRSAQEVADELGMSVNSVYLAKSRILSALRREADGLVD